MYKNFFLKLFDRKYFYLTILYIIFFLIILFLNNNIYLNEESIKHHSTYFRDDIVFVYNSLLYADGLEIHHLDHPSLFTYFLFSSFYKIFNLLGYINFSGLNGFLDSENIELSLNKLFYISRFVIQLTSLATIYLFYEIIKTYSQKNIVSFFITLIFIFSTGFVSASNRIESGLISFFLLIFGFYFFLKFIKNSTNQGLYYFAITFVFIFSAMMQKKIIFFLIPFLFISSAFLINKNSIEYFKYNFFKIHNLYKYILIVLYFFIIGFISYKTIINNTFFLPRDLYFIFLTLNYFGLNLVLFFFIKYFQNSKFTNLLTYNLIIGTTYVFYKFILIYFFSAPVAVWSISFTNFMGQLNLFVSNQEIKGAHEFNNLGLYLDKLINNFELVVNKYFFTITFHSILIWLNIILFFYNFKKIIIHEKLSLILLLIGFVTIQSILLFRYEQDTYYINSEILLLIALSINIKFFNDLKSSIFICSFVLILLINPIVLNFNKIKNINISSYCDNIEFGFYKYYTEKIPMQNIQKICLNYEASK